MAKKTFVRSVTS